MPTLTISCNSTSGARSTTTTIDFQSEQITVEEIIRSYVYQQVRESIAKSASQPDPSPVVQPVEEEIALNGTRGKRSVQWQVEFEKTKDAFDKRQIFVLVDGRQMNSLQDVVKITPSTDVRFLRLTMLMGG